MADKKDRNLTEPILLVGTRTGDILEGFLHREVVEETVSDQQNTEIIDPNDE